MMTDGVNVPIKRTTNVVNMKKKSFTVFFKHFVLLFLWRLCVSWNCLQANRHLRESKCGKGSLSRCSGRCTVSRQAVKANKPDPTNKQATQTQTWKPQINIREAGREASGLQHSNPRAVSTDTARWGKVRLLVVTDHGWKNKNLNAP